MAAETKMVFPLGVNKYPADKLDNSKFQMRQQSAVTDEFLESLKAHGGNFEPVVANEEGQVIVGHTRTEGCHQLDLPVLVNVIEVDDEQAWRMSAASNMARKEITLYEEIVAIGKLIEFGDTQDEVREQTGLSSQRCSILYRVAQLSRSGSLSIKNLIDSGVTYTDLRKAIKLKNDDLLSLENSAKAVEKALEYKYEHQLTDTQFDEFIKLSRQVPEIVEYINNEMPGIKDVLKREARIEGTLGHHFVEGWRIRLSGIFDDMCSQLEYGKSLLKIGGYAEKFNDMKTYLEKFKFLEEIEQQEKDTWSTRLQVEDLVKKYHRELPISKEKGQLEEILDEIWDVIPKEQMKKLQEKAEEIYQRYQNRVEQEKFEELKTKIAADIEKKVLQLKGDQFKSLEEELQGYKYDLEEAESIYQLGLIQENVKKAFQIEYLSQPKSNGPTVIHGKAEDVVEALNESRETLRQRLEAENIDLTEDEILSQITDSSSLAESQIQERVTQIVEAGNGRMSKLAALYEVANELNIVIQEKHPETGVLLCYSCEDEPKRAGVKNTPLGKQCLACWTQDQESIADVPEENEPAACAFCQEIKDLSKDDLCHECYQLTGFYNSNKELLEEYLEIVGSGYFLSKFWNFLQIKGNMNEQQFQEVLEIWKWYQSDGHTAQQFLDISQQQHKDDLEGNLKGYGAVLVERIKEALSYGLYSIDEFDCANCLEHFSGFPAGAAKDQEFLYCDVCASNVKNRDDLVLCLNCGRFNTIPEEGVNLEEVPCQHCKQGYNWICDECEQKFIEEEMATELDGSKQVGICINCIEELTKQQITDLDVEIKIDDVHTLDLNQLLKDLEDIESNYSDLIYQQCLEFVDQYVKTAGKVYRDHCYALFPYRVDRKGITKKRGYPLEQSVPSTRTRIKTLARSIEWNHRSENYYGGYHNTSFPHSVQLDQEIALIHILLIKNEDENGRKYRLIPTIRPEAIEEDQLKGIDDVFNFEYVEEED